MEKVFTLVEGKQNFSHSNLGKMLILFNVVQTEILFSGVQIEILLSWSALRNTAYSVGLRQK